MKGKMMSDTPIFDGMSGPQRPSPAPAPSNVPEPKVVAATVGGGVGVALATILVWTLEAALGIDVPEGVELASGVVITAALTFAAGWTKRN